MVVGVVEETVGVVEEVADVLGEVVVGVVDVFVGVVDVFGAFAGSSNATTALMANSTMGRVHPKLDRAHLKDRRRQPCCANQLMAVELLTKNLGLKEVKLFLQGSTLQASLKFPWRKPISAYKACLL